jgi:hypothetical protein
MVALIRARNAELDVVCEVPDTDHYLSNGWSKVDDDTLTTDEVRALYNPEVATVEQVGAYLAQADDAERERVKAVERDGKARKGVLEWEPVSE